MNKTLLAILALTLSIGSAFGANSNRGEYGWSPDRISISTKPPLLEAMQNAPGAPLSSIMEASVSAPDQVDSISAWNQYKLPLKTGFSHTFESRFQVEINLPAGSLESSEKGKNSLPYGQVMFTPDGDVMWTATIEVARSYRLRLNLSDLELPENAKIWVASDGDEVVGPFDAGLAGPSGNLWTPSVDGPTIRLIVMLPESDPVARFNITRVAELFRVSSSGQPIIQPEEDETPPPPCLKQSLCEELSTWPKIEDAEAATGKMNVIIGGESFDCSGGLIADKDASTTKPYFLSANHCFTTQGQEDTPERFQEAASALEVFWDFKPDACNGTKPELSTLPRTNGSTFKATGRPADYLLLELSSAPSGRYYLGYDTSLSAIAPGSTLHRIHYPGGDVAHYEQTRIEDGQNCDASWANDQHVWQRSVIGTTIGGSSGSPVMTTAGDIVGQLHGGCKNCSPDAWTGDGRLAAYYSEVEQFLDPSNSGGNSDLSLTALDAASGSFTAGDSFGVSTTVQNAGSATSGSYRVTFYASSDTTITSSDTNLASADRAALAVAGSDQFNTNVTLPSGLAAGSYYIGAILTPSDANSGNNTRYDSTTITVTGGSTSSFTVNAGLSGAWYDPAMNGQGFLLEVLPTQKVVFVAWFTYDATRPAGSDPSTVGSHGQRWLTGLGNYTSNMMTLPVYNASGGVFASGTPTVSQAQVGTMTVTFISCTKATIAFDLPDVPGQVIPVQRLGADNVAMCQSLSQ